MSKIAKKERVEFLDENIFLRLKHLDGAAAVKWCIIWFLYKV